MYATIPAAESTLGLVANDMAANLRRSLRRAFEAWADRQTSGAPTGQKDFAAFLGIHKSRMNDYMNPASRRMPGLDDGIRIASKLGITAEALVSIKTEELDRSNATQARIAELERLLKERDREIANLKEKLLERVLAERPLTPHPPRDLSTKEKVHKIRKRIGGI